jgi:hypothetical protein
MHAASGAVPCVLDELLEQGAIAGAGGGYTQHILDCLDYRSALALRAACHAGGDVVSRAWHAHALRPYHDLAVALRCFPALRELHINSRLARHVPEREWLHVIESGLFAQLRTLRMEENAFQDYGTYHDRWVAAVCSLPRLTHLELAISVRMTSKALSIVTDAPQLRVLDLDICMVQEVNEGALGALMQRSRALRSLGLRRVPFLSDSALAHVAECSTLRTVNLSSSQGLTARSLQLLSVAPALTELVLFGCTFVDDAALRHLECCRTLTKLDISLCQQESLTDSGLASLGRLPALRILTMSTCSQRTLTDAGFSALAQSRSLEALDMVECDQSTITDVALGALARCATLTRLDVTSCDQRGWSSAGARALASSRSLCSLDVTYTRLCEHLPLLCESASLESLSASLLEEQCFTQWAQANALLLHAPRLGCISVRGSLEPRTPAIDLNTAVAVLQSEWEERPAEVRERRTAAAAAAASAAAGDNAEPRPLTVELLHQQRFTCVLR